MNSTRIRYNKVGDVLVSTKNFIIGSDVVRVDIDGVKVNVIRTDGTFFGGMEIISSDKPITLHRMKIKAKEFLKELGVQFKDEVRVRKPKAE